MNQQPDHSTVFQLHYSYYLEHMTSILTRNIFNFLSMVQVVLGGTVMADLSKNFLLGLVIAILSAVLFIYKPGEISGRAKQQAKRYEILLNNLSTTSQSELTRQLSTLSEFDSDIPGSLRKPAWIRAAIATGNSESIIADEIRKLHWHERRITFLAGGIPR